MLKQGADFLQSAALKLEVCLRICNLLPKAAEVLPLWTKSYITKWTASTLITKVNQDKCSLLKNIIFHS